MPLENSGLFLVRAGKNVPGNMTELIDAMINYQNGAAPRVNELYIVYKECQHWIKKHVSSIWATTQNQREEAAVRWLMGSVIDELNTAEPGLGTAFENYELRSAGGKPKADTSKLGKGYRFERKTYVDSGKTTMPYSGSQVSDIAVANQTDFHKLTSKQWDEISSGQWSKKQVAVAQMYFLNKIQRLRLLATCVAQQGGVNLWEDIQGQKVNTKFTGAEMGSLNSRQMYAMDRYGNLFVDYDDYGYGTFVLNQARGPKGAAVNARGKSNHSSLCAGREVICAGTIFFWKGQMIHIDNSSGHYAPRPSALYSAVGILRDAGTNLNYLRVGVQLDGSRGKNMDYYKATTFLNHGNPDWQDQNDDSKQDNIYAGLPGFIP